MLARLLMCLGLIALLPTISAHRLDIAPVNAIGRGSLFFYLWHPLVIGAVMTGMGPAATFALSIIFCSPSPTSCWRAVGCCRC